MMTCPSCATEVSTLIAYTDPPKLGCRNCGVPKKKLVNCNLGQTDMRYQKADGSSGRITVGKRWEIENRTISKDDNFTVINKVTGKETQY